MSLKNKKILAVGSLTLDLFLKPRRQELFEKKDMNYLGFCLGDKIRIQERHEMPGGGGANVAVGLSRFGLSSGVLGKIGKDDAAQRILNTLKKEKVDTDLIAIDDESGSGFSVIFSATSGERVVFFTPGANERFCHIETSLLDEFDGVCIQHLSGCSYNVFLEMGKYFLQHPKKFVTWNPGRESLEQGVKKFTDLLSVLNILLLNKEEAQLFTGKENIEEAFRSFFQRGCTGNVIITDGQKGSYGCDGKKIYACPILSDSSRVDTLGAGDSFLSGATGAILSGKELPEAMKFGTMNATNVVAYFGAHYGLQTETELQKQISKLSVSTTPFSF